MNTADQEVTNPTSSGLAVSKFLVFKLGEDQFAIPLLKVKEVIGVPSITSMPDTPDYFRGVMNLRGQIISVIDLRTKLEFPNTDSAASTTVVIVDISSVLIGVVVDSVEAVFAVDAVEIKSRPMAEESGIDQEFLEGVAIKDDRLVLLMDIEKILSRDLEDLSSSKRAA